MGIVLPDAILGSPGLGYIREWLIQNHRIIASIDLHVDTFQPRNGTQTSVLILQKKTQAKKDAERERGHVLDDTENARVTASNATTTAVDSLMDSYQDTISKQIAKDHPMHVVQYRLKQAQGGLSGLTGQKLHKKAAEVLYYKSLTKIMYLSWAKPVRELVL